MRLLPFAVQYSFKWAIQISLNSACCLLHISIGTEERGPSAGVLERVNHFQLGYMSPARSLCSSSRTLTSSGPPRAHLINLGNEDNDKTRKPDRSSSILSAGHFRIRWPYNYITLAHFGRSPYCSDSPVANFADSSANYDQICFPFKSRDMVWTFLPPPTAPPPLCSQRAPSDRAARPSYMSISRACKFLNSILWLRQRPRSRGRPDPRRRKGLCVPDGNVTFKFSALPLRPGPQRQWVAAAAVANMWELHIIFLAIIGESTTSSSSTSSSSSARHYDKGHSRRTRHELAKFYFHNLKSGGSFPLLLLPNDAAAADYDKNKRFALRW